MKRKVLRSVVLAGWLAVVSPWLAGQAAAPPPAGTSADSAAASNSAAPAAASGTVVKQLGSIRAIEGVRLSLATDQGAELAVKVQPGARLLRLAPGQTDLKNAAAIQLSDLQVGDRVLVRGKMDADGVSLDAASVLVMKREDIAQQKQQEMRDWQRRSVGGMVQQVDPQAARVTISVAGAGAGNAALPAAGAGSAGGAGSAAGAGVKTVLVLTTPKTSYKRYAPDSVKWEEARNSHFGEIHAGDQLRAKGNRSQDGAQMEAEDIVFGSFRNIAGLITAIGAPQQTLTVQDLATRKPVTVKITADSQMRRLPPQMAMGLAMRLKGATAPEADSKPTKPAAESAPNVASASPDGGQGEPPAKGGRGRGGDLNQMLARLPAIGLSDLLKGEAVMIVSTEGSAGQLPTAVTLLGGVEPILSANPGGRGTESLLTPWSLATAPGGDQP
jgi:hypothetical protein